MVHIGVCVKSLGRGLEKGDTSNIRVGWDEELWFVFIYICRE